MQYYPVVALPMTDQGQGNLIQLIDQLRIGLGGLGAEPEGFRTAPQAQQGGAIAGGADKFTYMVEAPVGPIASSHGGHTGCAAILLIELPDTRMGTATANSGSPHDVDQSSEAYCDQPVILKPVEHAAEPGLND
jgi:hypothetical protein